MGVLVSVFNAVLRAEPALWLLRWRSRGVWRSPDRTVRTLEAFARTETDAGHELKAAARLVDDAGLRYHLERHARDELRHGELFRRRATELRAEVPEAAHAPSDEDDKLFDLLRARSEHDVDDHGFLTVHELERAGDVAYVAYLHVAEQRAAAHFRVHASLLRHDPRTLGILTRVLDDEVYHVAWTGKFLRRCQQQGRDREVREALRQARGSRLLGAWRRFGALAGAHAGQRLMTLFYFTVAVPFAIVARTHPTALGWQNVCREPGLDACRSQH